MRKALLAFPALVAVTFVASVASRTEASPLANPSALSGAIDELAVVDNVHCRPGWAHHSPTRWRRANGCLRESGGVVVVPGRTRYIYRDGVRVRVGGDGARGDRTTIRSRTDVNVREGGGRREGGVNVREGGGTEGRGGQRDGGQRGGQRDGGGMPDR
jgi:hypothetical protein